jgi:ribosomal protein S18 acetylase RimI-like enzyme
MRAGSLPDAMWGILNKIFPLYTETQPPAGSAPPLQIHLLRWLSCGVDRNQKIMKPELLMICLLRSSVAALATRHRGVGGVGGRRGTAAGGGGPAPSSGLPRRMETASDGGGGGVGGDRRATSSSTTSSPSSSSLASSSGGGGGGRIAFRLARRSDVAGIQECNLATLPENYNSNFYVNHVREWPELSLVAEHVPEGWEDDEEEEEDDDDDYDYDGGRGGWGGGGGGVDADRRRHRRDDYEYGGRSSSTRITPLGEYWDRKSRRRMRRRQSGDDGGPRKEIVGYILGKIEERPRPRLEFPPSRVYEDDDYYDCEEEETLLRYLDNGNDPHDEQVSFPSPWDQQQRLRWRDGDQSPRPRPRPRPRERHGHVTSLAVRSHARRLGIASSLLRQLHYHLRECRGAGSVGLHVRVSNEAAVMLYCAEGYDVADVMPLYYGDGE